MAASSLRWWLSTAAVIGLAATSAPAFAATASASGDAASASDEAAAAQIQAVVVTARRREENLQDVPVAVSVVSGDAAISKNVNDIQDLSSEVPVVDFRTGASNKDRTVFVRGTGTISTSPGVEPSVSMVVDGVVMARPGQATVDFDDVDHVEVLRGPQGTLFGKNASAGVVNIVTRDPTSTYTGYATFGAFSGDEFRGGAMASGPILGDKLEGLISVFGGAFKGNVNNIFSGQTDNGYRHLGGRIKLLFQPASNLKVTLNLDYTNSVDTNPTGIWVSSNHIAYPTNIVTPNAALAGVIAATGITPSASNMTISDNLDSNVHDDNGGVSVTAVWDMGGGYDLTSITAWRDWRNVQHQDYDQLSQFNASIPQGADTGHLQFNQTSEEMRLASPKGHFIDYVVGLYYLNAVDKETYERDITHIVAGATRVDSGVANYGTTGNNFALFGEADVNLTQNFRGIIGYREVWDDLSFFHSRVSTAPTTGVGGNFAATGSTNKTGWAGRFGLQYDLNKDTMAYVTYSHGYKGPAFNVFFNMAAVNTPPLNPETSNSYEAGLKSQLFDHHLQTDLAAYITDFQNYQANFTQQVNGGLTTNLINAGSVTTRGVEGDLIAKPFGGLTLTGDFSYDDAYVVKFQCPPGAPVSCNINGQPLPFAPRWKFHAEADDRIPVAAGWDADLLTEYNWQSKTQYSLAETPDTVQGSYGLWNASVGLVNDTLGWSARLLVRNIMDTNYSAYMAYGDLGGVVRFVDRDARRYVGIELRKDF